MPNLFLPVSIIRDYSCLLLSNMPALIEKDIPAITEFLLRTGCEIIPITSSNELLRFKGKETGVIYTTGNTSGRYVQKMLECYISHTFWDGAPDSTKRRDNKKYRVKLLKRDGDTCSCCGLPMGDDVTVEHWVALTAGGKNILSNMALMHFHCNSALGNKPLFEKINYIIELRLILG